MREKGHRLNICSLEDSTRLESHMTDLGYLCPSFHCSFFDNYFLNAPLDVKWSSRS